MRMEHDTMGEIAVPAERHWGAQTQRSLENFPIGTEKMPREILEANHLDPGGAFTPGQLVMIPFRR